MTYDHPAVGRQRRGKGPRTKRAKRRRREAAAARREAEWERQQAAQRVREAKP